MSTSKRALQYMEKRFGRLTFAKAIRAWRFAEGLSQVQFAKKIGVSVQSLCDLEKGRRVPSAVRASRIAKKVGAHELAWVQLAIQDSAALEGFYVDVLARKVI